MAQQNKPDSKKMDAETQAMLFEGASLSQLAQMFGQDVRKVKAKLHGCAPSDTRAGHPIYRIKDAARYLVEPIWGIDEYITRMNHADLPMMLRKEYWAGMRSKQIYEQAAGDLWPTEQVIDLMSGMLKTISMSLKLASDAVDREVGLTSQQRKTVISLMDSALANAHDKLKHTLSESQERPAAATAGDADDDL